MKMRLFTHIPGIMLAVLLTLLVSSVGANDRTLEGTWDVLLQFPAETCTTKPECNCPPPTIMIPTLNTFLRHGGMLWSGGALAVGPGQGVWERLGRNQYIARFKFFIFDLTTGRRTGSEELTKDIRLTGPDTFEATTTYDLFDPAGNPTATACVINETATRFE